MLHPPKVYHVEFMWDIASNKIIRHFPQFVRVTLNIMVLILTKMCITIFTSEGHEVSVTKLLANYLHNPTTRCEFTHTVDNAN